MTRYLIDSSVLIDFSVRREPAHGQLLDLMNGPHDIALTAVQISEFFAGVPTPDRIRWSNFLASLSFWTISPAAARQAGIYRYDYARRGISLSTPDTLIAAVAQEQSAIVVTGNAKDFPMPDVQVLIIPAKT